MNSAIEKFAKFAASASKATKLTSLTVHRGLTALPTKSIDEQSYGLRADFDGEMVCNGVKYNKFEIQPNAGSKIPSAVEQWRDKNGGTHAKIGSIYVKDGGTQEDVKHAFEEFLRAFKKGARTPPPGSPASGTPSQSRPGTPTPGTPSRSREATPSRSAPPSRPATPSKGGRPSTPSNKK